MIELLNPDVLIYVIPMLIVLGWVVTEVLKHRERMAMIERGMIPPDTETRQKRR